MSKTKIWSTIYYKLILGMVCKLFQKQIFKAYGVTHSRCAFIHDYYGLKQNKIDFLPIGADVDLADTISPRTELRRKYGFNDSDFIVVSGGKMGNRKGTDTLIRAVEELHDIYPQLKLALFGKFDDVEVENQAHRSTLTTVFGWCDRIMTLELLKMASVACWPIHHTTLIEDSISVCTPVINRGTSTSEHLINGNGVSIKDGTIDEIKDALLLLLNQNEKQHDELCFACKKMKQTIGYHTIAKKVLSDISEF